MIVFFWLQACEAYDCKMSVWVGTCNIIGGPKMANPAICNQQENLDKCNGMRRTHQCTPTSDEPPIQVLADNLMNCYVSLLSILYLSSIDFELIRIFSCLVNYIHTMYDCRIQIL